MNFNFFQLLADSTPLPNWITASFPIIQIILVAIIAICAIGLIVLVFLQESNSNGLGSLGGAENSFYSQNKGNSREGRMKKWTYILAGIIFVLTILYFISFTIYHG